MLEYARRQFRRTVFKTYRYLKHPRRLKRNRALHWFSRHFLDKRVWKPTQHTLAGGLAIGMFVTSIIFPGQMPVAIILAGLFRVNVPIAVIACWLSNPVTFAPMIVAEVKVGEWFLNLVGIASNGDAAIAKARAFLSETYHGKLSLGEVWHHFYDLLGVAKELYVGALVVGVILSVVGYLMVYGLWALVAEKSAVHSHHLHKNLPVEARPAQVAKPMPLAPIVDANAKHARNSKRKKRHHKPRKR